MPFSTMLNGIFFAQALYALFGKLFYFQNHRPMYSDSAHFFLSLISI